MAQVKLIWEAVRFVAISIMDIPALFEDVSYPGWKEWPRADKRPAA
jgi:hypothetical protein